MSGFSPSAYLLWSILSCLFQTFLVVHLYNYDKFQCVKWGSGRQPGAFKRVMTYSYLATVPLLMVFALAMTVLSYQQGYLVTPEGTVLSLPFAAWSHTARKCLLPLYFVLAFAWALELVTHLEELTFWLFLLHQGPQKRDWFNSWEFRVWYLGSMIAILGMPIAVIVRRANLDLCYAWIFLSGSAAGLVTSLCFIYVLARFPGFIRRVKSEGAEPEVVVRLSIFYQLNVTRIVFRFLFHFPLLILALDSVRGPHDVVRIGAASDLLTMLGGIGCFVSSAITLFVFFPRSITRETGYRVKISSTPSVDKMMGRTFSPPDYHREPDPSSPKTPNAARMANFHYPQNHGEPARHSQHFEGEATPQYESDPENNYVGSTTMHGRRWAPGIDDEESAGWGEMRSDEGTAHQRYHYSRSRDAREAEERPSQDDSNSMHKSVGRPGKDRHSGVIVIPHIPRVPPSRSRPMVVEEPSLSRHSSVVHPYAMNFTSPIDLLDPEDDLVPRAI